MKIENFKRIDKEGSSLKAGFKVLIPEWDFNIVMTYFEKSDGQKWFGYPSREYRNEAGEKKYQWLAHFGEKGRPRFEKALTMELAKHLNLSAPEPEIDWNAQDIPF